MSTAVWPPIDPEELKKAEEETLARELEWLLDSLQETFNSLKNGLEDCANLLSPEIGATTLVLSSLRSESIKGFVTRHGCRIVKGDVNLKLSTITPPKNAPAHKLSVSTAPQAPTITLHQLTDARNLINACLDVIDISKWTGDPQDADFISGQLRLLSDNVSEARQALKGGAANQRPWWEAPIDDEVFDPPCPPNISFHLSIADAALVLQVRALEPTDTPPNAESLTGFGLRDRLAVALGATKTLTHEELDDVFVYRDVEVRVKEKLRVESQDPRLLSAMAKLSALEHSVAMSRKALETVMGKEE